MSHLHLPPHRGGLRRERRAGGRPRAGSQDGCTTCADETMKPTSESLSPTEARSGRVAKAYCAAAMRSEELAEAKHRSQTKVNSSRPFQRASCRGNHICRKSFRGVLAKPGSTIRPVPGANRVKAGARALKGVWSGNGGRWHGVSQDRCRTSEKADDRTPVVAMKRVTSVEPRGVGR